MGWQPRYVVTKAPGVSGPPIDPGEPVIVIRAQDKMSLRTLKDYLDRYDMLPDHQYDSRVAADLRSHLAALLEWQRDHPGQMKWPDR